MRCNIHFSNLIILISYLDSIHGKVERKEDGKEN